MSLIGFHVFLNTHTHTHTYVVTRDKTDVLKSKTRVHHKRVFGKTEFFFVLPLSLNTRTFGRHCIRYIRAVHNRVIDVLPELRGEMYTTTAVTTCRGVAGGGCFLFLFMFSPFRAIRP